MELTGTEQINMEEQKKQYWDGSKNKAIRMYFYCNRGIALFNEFRYVAMVIFGIYMLMKLDNPLWLLVMFIISIPILIIAGWAQVHHIAKVINWLDVQYASFWTRYSFNLQEKQIKLLEEIKDKGKV